MALRDVFDDPDLRALEGQLIRLDVGPQEFSIALADPDEAQQYWDDLRPRVLAHSAVRPVRCWPATVVHSCFDDAISIGSKAANMAEMLRIGIGVDSAAAGSVRSSVCALRRSSDRQRIDRMIDDLLEDAPSLGPSELQRASVCGQVGDLSAPLDPQFRAELVSAVRSRWGDDRKVRFRSSTNAEDLPEFSGAGLYTSASGNLSDGEQTIENALKVVWASAWNYQAFVERDFYRVVHRDIRMGVLVHPSFVREQANGVVVTINEFTQSRPAFYINSQIGDISVTNPTGLRHPRTAALLHLVRGARVRGHHQVVLTDGEVLSAAELDELADYLTAIHAHFAGRIGDATGSFAMDVEFKLGPDREVIIKQARPLVRR